MLLFAHTGITLGLGWLIKEKAATRLSASSSKVEVTLSSVSGDVAVADMESGSSKSLERLTKIAAGLDLRVLVISSMLPDIIDKPLGQVVLRQSLNNGRIYSHTLLFLILITVAGVLLYHNRHQIWMILLASGTVTHLVMDKMWQTPQIFFWPLSGTGFPRGESTISGWAGQMFQELFSNPAVFIPELIGLVILLSFSVVLIKKGQVKSFLYHG